MKKKGITAVGEKLAITAAGDKTRLFTLLQPETAIEAAGINTLFMAAANTYSEFETRNEIIIIFQIFLYK